IVGRVRARSRRTRRGRPRGGRVRGGEPVPGGAAGPRVRRRRGRAGGRPARGAARGGRACAAIVVGLRRVSRRADGSGQTLTGVPRRLRLARPDAHRRGSGRRSGPDRRSARAALRRGAAPMSNPILGARRIRGMWPRLLATASALALLPAANAARAADPVLTGDVGRDDSFAISLTDASGVPVTHLDVGTYSLVVHDRSAFHNFHLSGPGVDQLTSVPDVEDKTFTVTLTDGTYFVTCDAHAAQMRRTFTVGT